MHNNIPHPAFQKVLEQFDCFRRFAEGFSTAIERCQVQATPPASPNRIQGRDLYRSVNPSWLGIRPGTENECAELIKRENNAYNNGVDFAFYMMYGRRISHEQFR